MSIRFRLLTEADVRAVLDVDELIDAMADALNAFSSGTVVQPVRTVVPVSGDDALFGIMPAFVRGADETDRTANSGAARSLQVRGALGAKLVTVFGANTAQNLPTHLASIVLLDARSGALKALMDGRYITELRTAAVSALSSRLLSRPGAATLAIIGSGVQARSHLEALGRVHRFRYVTVWSPTQDRRERFVKEAADAGWPAKAVGHAGEAIVGADVIVLATASPSSVIESGWVKPGAHVISVGACRPTHREMDPALVARSRLFVDSRAAALVESGDVVMGINEGLFTADHIAGELGEVVGGKRGRHSDTEITVFKSLGLAVEDVTAADLVYRLAVERGIGRELEM